MEHFCIGIFLLWLFIALIMGYRKVIPWLKEEVRITRDWINGGSPPPQPDQSLEDRTAELLKEHERRKAILRSQGLDEHENERAMIQE